MQPCPVTAKFDNFAGVQIFQNYTSPGGELAACKQYISWLAGGHAIIGAGYPSGCSHDQNGSAALHGGDYPPESRGRALQEAEI